MLMRATVPSDPVFEPLDCALDAARAGQVIAEELARAGYPTRSLTCTIERSRIKRGRKALIGYRLRGVGPDGEALDQRLMVTLFPNGDRAALPDMRSDAALTTPSFGPPMLTLQGLGGQAWFFPNDRKVHHIARLLDEKQGQVQVMHYVPEQGCTIRVTGDDGRVFFGKCRADDRARVAASIVAQSAPSERLRLAEITDFDPDHRILWQAAVQGNALDWHAVMADPQLWADRIAAAVQAFHDLAPPSHLKQLTFESIGQTITRRITRMSPDLPGLEERLSQMSARLCIGIVDPQPLALGHGDLHPGNLLWDGHSFALIDLDTAALAPRALDFGTLAASLVYKAVEADETDDAILSMLNAFRRAVRTDAVDGRLFDWAVAASLLGERLYRCTTRMKSPRQIARERLLCFAEQLRFDHA